MLATAATTTTTSIIFNTKVDFVQKSEIKMKPKRSPKNEEDLWKKKIGQ